MDVYFYDARASMSLGHYLLPAIGIFDIPRSHFETCQCDSIIDMALVITVCLFLISCSNAIESPEGKVHRTCKLSGSSRIEGTCQDIGKCPYALGNLKVGVDPTICEGSGNVQQVCCPIVKRISEKKCEDYMNIFRKNGKRKGRKLFLESFGNPSTTKTPPTSTTSKPEITPEDNDNIICPLFVRISGGRDASKDEFPFQVALGYGPIEKVEWRCGGVLVSDLFVLTASHCISTKFGPPTKVLLGDRILSKKESQNRAEIAVEKILKHPEYNSSLLYNDIALIKLAKNVNLSRSIVPACLPQPQHRLDKKKSVTVTGFGQLGAMDSTSDILQSADLKRFPLKDCTNIFMNDSSSMERLPQGLQPSQFCAGDREGIKDTCHGDSGGPAVVTREHPCQYYAIGITSFGSTFCGYQQPGIYTNVQRYLDWIEENVWPHETAIPHETSGDSPQATTPTTPVPTSSSTTTPSSETKSTRFFLAETTLPSTTASTVEILTTTPITSTTTTTLATTTSTTPKITTSTTPKPITTTKRSTLKPTTLIPSTTKVPTNILTTTQRSKTSTIHQIVKTTTSRPSHFTRETESSERGTEIADTDSVLSSTESYSNTDENTNFNYGQQYSNLNGYSNLNSFNGVPSLNNGFNKHSYWNSYNSFGNLNNGYSGNWNHGMTSNNGFYNLNHGMYNSNNALYNPNLNGYLDGLGASAYSAQDTGSLSHRNQNENKSMMHKKNTPTQA